MVNDDVVKWPLCGGFIYVENPVLWKALRTPTLREQIERYFTDLLNSPVEDLTGVASTQAGRDLQKGVRHWNPSVPSWRRSPKE